MKFTLMKNINNFIESMTPGQYNRVIAINGCLHREPFKEYLNLQKQFSIKNLEYKAIVEDNGGIENFFLSGELENKTIYNLNLIDLDQESIVNVFRALCDKRNYDEKLRNTNSFLIVIGNWNTISLRDKIFDDGASYHFNEGSNLYYCMDLGIENKDYLNYKDGYYSKESRKEIWDYIIDFSKGELFSTWFLSGIIQEKQSLGILNKTIQSNCSNFISHYANSPLWNDLMAKFKDYDHIHSFKTRTDLPEYDLIKRSNLFVKSSQAGDGLIFKTNHYLSRFTLYNIGKSKPENQYQPQFPILRKHMLIAEEVLEVEKEVKHVLKNYFTMKDIKINSIPISVKNSNNSYIMNSFNLDNKLNKMVRPEDKEHPEIKKFINSLTFGSLIHLMTEIENILMTVKGFNIGEGKQVEIQNNAISKLELENDSGNSFLEQEEKVTIKLQKGDLIHIRQIPNVKKKNIVTVIREDRSEILHYVLQSQNIKKQVEETGYSVSYLEDNKDNDSKYTNLFKNYNDIKSLLEKMRHFRNAVLHNRALDESEFDDFDNKIAEFYELISIS